MELKYFIHTDAPQVTLRLGSTFRQGEVKEGNDVFFECNIRANPWVTEISWYFEGKELRTNTSAGIIISNQTLVLQNVNFTRRGNYYCSATNADGTGTSNEVFLRVKCKTLFYYHIHRIVKGFRFSILLFWKCNIRFI